jgi:hypothetical protein
MKSPALKLSIVLALTLFTSGLPAAAPGADAPGAPAFEAIGPLTFGTVGTDDVLFAADQQAAKIYAITLGSAATGGAPGTKPIAAVDRQIAALLGTDVKAMTITDLAVHPKTKNAFVSVMRGQGADAKPVLLRIDGAGDVKIVNLAELKATSVTLPNAPNVAPAGQRSSRAQSITDMAYVNGRLFIAGLSNEEFASKLRSVPYPFATVDNGTSVEIYHGNHGAFETRSPVFAFVPYTINNTAHLVAGYTCTPLVKFPVDSLRPGQKVVGTTIAELGAGNRPIDMIVYKKGGRDFLLMSNTSRGVMKIPTDTFGSAQGITSRIGGTAGVPFETITSMQGIEQLDLLDANQTLVLARADGALNLATVSLP